MNIEYKTVVKDFENYRDQIFDFYAFYYGENYKIETIDNSAVICLAFSEGKIVGAVRAVSDLTRHALIVDLIVKKSFRRQGIGSKLIQAVVKELKSHGVKYVVLGKDPRYPWLKDFYLQLGFTSMGADEYFEI